MAGGKMKEAGVAHWSTPNTGANNESGFSALPGGYCGGSGFFSDLGMYGIFWSATDYDTDIAYDWGVRHSSSEISYTMEGKLHGFSIRLVKD